MELIGWYVPFLLGGGTTSPLIDEVGQAQVFEAASDSEQGVGTRFRPAASRLFEPAQPVPNFVLTGALDNARVNRQSTLPAKVVAHLVCVDLAAADVGRDGFGPPRGLAGASRPRFDRRPPSAVHQVLCEVLGVHTRRSYPEPIQSLARDELLIYVAQLNIQQKDTHYGYEL